jgi:hypothetical protein
MFVRTIKKRIMPAAQALPTPTFPINPVRMNRTAILFARNAPAYIRQFRECTDTAPLH